MLNPINVQQFYQMVEMGADQVDDIMARFGFLTVDSIECFVSYVNN